MPGCDFSHTTENAPNAEPSKAEVIAKPGFLGNDEGGTDRTDSSIDHSRVVAKDKPS